MKRITLKTVVLGLLLIATPALVFADAVWIAQEHGELAIVYSHGAESGSYPTEKLMDVEGFDVNKKRVSVSLHPRVNHAVLETQDAAIVTVRFDNGYWYLGEDGKWANLPKRPKIGARDSGHFLKFNVSVLRTGGNIGGAFGLPLEIVPDVDPLTLRQGDELSLQVLFHGRPISDAPVVADYANLVDTIDGRTDRNGRIKVRVRNEGLNVIAAKIIVPTPSDPFANSEETVSTLSFTLPHLPD